MSAEWEVVVVGAGIVGCAVGRELARRGVKIAIIEPRGVAGGATQASAGVLAPFIEAPHDGDFHGLAVRSLAMYDGFVRDLEQETQGDTAHRNHAGRSIEYRVCGTLEVAAGASACARLSAVAKWAQAAGVEATWLEGGDAVRLEPALAPVDGALLVPSHAYVGAESLAAGLIASAQHHGATLLSDRVERIERDGQGVTVKTQGTTRRAARAVVAAGSWSPALTADALPVRPIRGQLLRLHWPGCPIGRILWSDACYVVPWTDGTVLVGATVEDVGFDERTTVAGVRGLLDAACDLMPAVERGGTFIEARVGLRPATPDGLPIIGESPESPAIVYATGHYRNGILLAPLTASLVADLIVNGRRDPALSVTAPGRFA